MKGEPALALGGRATLLGPVLGAIGIDVTSSYLSGSLPFLWKLLVGIAFVLVIVLLPRGLGPLIARPFAPLAMRLRRRSDGDGSVRIEIVPPAMDILRATGLDAALGTETRSLSHGMKRGLEIAMVLATEPSVLLLDEPTAGLTKAERTAIGEVLARLSREHDICILLIEHDLDFVRDISSRVVVLRQGAMLMEGTVAEVVASDLVKSVYAGEQLTEA